MGKSVYHLPDWAYHFRKRILPRMKFTSVAGAAANVEIAVAGIKADDVILVANWADNQLPVHADATQATVDCAAMGTGGLDTVVAFIQNGYEGNEWRLLVKGDSAVGGGVTIDVDHVYHSVVIHFEAGVSTVADVEAAIAALNGADQVIEVGTAGTGATVLGATDIGNLMFTGGVGARNVLPIFSSPGKIKFPSLNTAGSDIVIGYFVY